MGYHSPEDFEKGRVDRTSNEDEGNCAETESLPETFDV